MRKKVFTALLLAGALAVLPIGGQLGSLIASASYNTNVNTNTESRPVNRSGNMMKGAVTLLRNFNNLAAGQWGSIVPGSYEAQSICNSVERYLSRQGAAEYLTDALIYGDAKDVKTVEDVEAMYMAASARENTAIDSAVEGYNGDTVKVVGVGLNVYADGINRATLKMAEVSEKPDVPDGYSNAVMLDISIEGLQSSDSLSTPVMITVPIPSIIPAEKAAVLHYASDGTVDVLPCVREGDDQISFVTTSFSVFAIVEKSGTSSAGSDADGSDDSDDDDDGNGGAGGYLAEIENQITGAVQGATVKMTDVNTLSNGAMKALLERKDVTLVMEYTYDGKNYIVTIPAGAAVNNDIPWYGPLYLAAHYGSGSVAAAGGSGYVVKNGDTMSKIAKANGMTLAQLAAKNPQIKNINLIKVGQKINLR